MATHRNSGRLTEAPAQPGPAQPGSAQPGPGHPIPAEPDPAQPDESPHAPLAESLARVGDRWTLLLVAALLEGPKRFGDLQQELPDIAPNVLTQRLRQLARNALILARP